MNEINIEQRFKDFVIHSVNALQNVKFNRPLNEACLRIAWCGHRSELLLTTGMGKAGHIAQKSASLFSSLGIQAVYVHPGEASHGDIGVIGSHSVLLAFSTSGKTREVIETIEAARKLSDVKVISITSHPDGLIREHSDLVLDMGVIKEAGYLGLAPTTSTLVMQMLSDFVAVTAAEILGTKVEDYALRHHGGYLGKLARRKAR